MLKLLVKKQLMEIFRSYFYNPKTNKKRSTGAVIGFVVLFAIIMIGMLGTMFTTLSVSLCKTFIPLQMGWMIFGIMGLLGIFLGAFGSVFNTFSGLYLAKDNELLLSLPIPVRSIILSRLLSVYLMGLMYSAVVTIPAAIVYCVYTTVTPAVILGCTLMVLIISMIVLVLSCLLGWVVARISLKLKNKSFIRVLTSLLFIGAYYFFYYKAQGILRNLIANAVTYGQKIQGSAYPVYLFARVGEGDWKAMGLVTLATVLVLLLTWRILSRSFLHIATATGKTKKAAFKADAIRTRSISGALLSREFGRYASSPVYILNCTMGTLFLLVITVAVLIKSGTVLPTLGKICSEYSGFIPVLTCAIVCMVASMNDSAIPSVSLEGKNLWLIQSLPVRPWDALKAKLQVQLLLTAPPAFLCSVCLAIILPGTLAERLLMILAILLYVAFSALSDLMLGIKSPNLTWTNEMVPIKQSFNVFIAMMAGWIYSVALGGLFFLCDLIMSASVYLGIVCLLTAGLSLLLYRWLKTKGANIFASL